MCLAIPGKLIEKISTEGGLTGRVAFGGVVRQVSLDFLPEAELGDYVLVHVGFAISRVDEEEARTTFAYLQQAGLLNEELGPEDESGPEPLTADSPGLKLHADLDEPQLASFPAADETMGAGPTR